MRQYLTCFTQETRSWYRWRGRITPPLSVFKLPRCAPTSLNIRWCSKLLYCEWLQSVDLPSSAHPFVRGL